VPPKSLFSIPVVISGYLPSELNGPDPYAFDPKRFIVTQQDGKESLRDEGELAKEGFMPWITGPRACPGKKFSQVEFAAVVSSLLSTMEIKVAEGQRSMAQARKRLNDAVANTTFNLGTTINNAQQYDVQFVPRQR
jgi:hypothetical protein